MAPPPNEVVEGAQRLVHRHVGVEAVHVVQVDVVGLQVAEAVLALLDDVAAAHAAAVGVIRVGREEDLRRDDEPVAVAALLHHLADDRLATSWCAAVNVRGVEEVQAGVERRVQDLGRLILRGPVAEHPAADAEWADFDAGPSERAVFHEFLRDILGISHRARAKTRKPIHQGPAWG
jgi:hypothetical protein